VHPVSRGQPPLPTSAIERPNGEQQKRAFGIDGAEEDGAWKRGQNRIRFASPVLESANSSSVKRSRISKRAEGRRDD